MSITDYRGVLLHLSAAGGALIDPRFAERLAEVGEAPFPPTPDIMTDLIDMATDNGLAIDAVIYFLDLIWQDLGGSVPQVQRRRRVRDFKEYR